MYASKLTKEIKNAALNLLTLINEKRDGRIKGRVCADGRKQRIYIRKYDVASPTMQLESLMITLLIDAYEGRGVATVDMVGAYLMADMNDTIIVKLTGESLKPICETNEKYKKFITIENGKEFLCKKLLKALYGCMQSAIFWYETFKGCLEALGFKLNKYDLFIANKIIDGNQCTVGLYVDDTKISHVKTKSSIRSLNN